MPDFESTRTAFMVARERADVAAAFERNTLHTAIYDAREAGMSIRETAVSLRVPKSTVARYWRGSPKRRDDLPLWGSPNAWREAHEAIWAHEPSELADTFIPYEWAETDGQRSVQARYRGVAVQRKTEPGQ
ncbi:hypothetical protein M4D50_11180 [Rothia sp. p3-SID1597]|nr:hypothetical protein [Rothia sp. p3-SID1597]